MEFANKMLDRAQGAATLAGTAGGLVVAGNQEIARLTGEAAAAQVRLDSATAELGTYEADTSATRAALEAVEDTALAGNPAELAAVRLRRAQAAFARAESGTSGRLGHLRATVARREAELAGFVRQLAVRQAAIAAEQANHAGTIAGATVITTAVTPVIAPALGDVRRFRMWLWIGLAVVAANAVVWANVGLFKAIF